MYCGNIFLQFMIYNITFAERLITKTGTFQPKEETDAQCSCYTQVWRGLACLLLWVCQYLVVEQREFHASFFGG
ncbi:hypothetical protein CLI85_03215 [Tannerella forsythia]|uniref:Uncharacterized protein n=1 Tax=Tannerella forsythia TaxID=28112 RepID=A0A2A6E7V2_TANFO|nr:hypothetical protein CLI86_07365 [Tannerella forsythia]PDP71546.1 hypothetical protein CLI85_03215 [Tannerella forsythia]